MASEHPGGIGPAGERAGGSNAVPGATATRHGAAASSGAGQPHSDSAWQRYGRRLRTDRPFAVAVGVVALVVIVLIVYLAHAASRRKAPVQSPGAAITVAKSRTGSIDTYVDALGTVTPTYTVTVYSQITGTVMGVHYQEGQMVRKGDPLIDIDPRPSEATLTQAEGTLERDRGILAQARIDLGIYRAAYARNGIGRQQLLDQEQIVVQDEGTVKADEGTVAYDRVQLSYCHIVAPIGGRVGLRLVDPGNVVFSGSSSTLLVITQLQPITVVFPVSEDDLSQVQTQLRSGRTLQVTVFDRTNEHAIENGMLSSLDNVVDTTTGTVRFRATFANADLALFPNQFVNARLLVDTLSNVTLVPTPAVQHNGSAAFVYVVRPDNTVATQSVTTPASNEQDTAVQGVGPGVTVATSGFDRLENGVRVSIRPSLPAGSSSSSSSSSASAP
jgi:membrane fusion protein, multidrug efflux system